LPPIPGFSDLVNIFLKLEIVVAWFWSNKYSVLENLSIIELLVHIFVPAFPFVESAGFSLWMPCIWNTIRISTVKIWWYE